MAEKIAIPPIDSDMDPAPRHVAIIMDGNGRWASERGLPRAMGHRAGVEAVRRTVKAAIELGVPYLTLFSFSSENWSRPQSEIDDLMGIMKRFIRQDLADLHQNNVCLRVIGDRTNVEPDMLALIDEAVELTSENQRLTLIIAFNYGARDEIARAAAKLAADAAAGVIVASDITPQSIDGALDTAGLPDPDLLIRTSGEMRLSNFLLWQAAYAELVFFDTYWPDFGADLLKDAVARFKSRDRRFGGLNQRSTG